jgi:FemAB-related protein (PEP-CTERM system-associated)
MRVTTLKEFSGNGEALWNEFVDSHPDSTFFHKAEWSTVLNRAFGHKPHFLMAVDEEGVLQGVLPLAEVKSLLFGHSLTSLPMCVYGGVVAHNEEAKSALLQHASDLADHLQVDAMELRHQAPSGHDWPTKHLYFTFKKELSSDNEENMKAIPRKRRAMIRGGIAAGLSSESDSGVNRFFAAYAESVRNLGTPVFSKKYFRVLREVFGDDCRVMMITHEGKDVASLMSFYFKKEVLPYYAGSFESAKHLKAHDFMYWELMRLSVDEGYRVFDFGRSKEGTGPYSFKKGWGFEPTPLAYEYYLVKSPSIPEVNPTNPKYKFFINAWTRLPLPIANCVGPFLSKSLG